MEKQLITNSPYRTVMIPKNSKKRLREHDELAEEYLKMLPISQQAHPNKRFMTEQLEE